MKKIFISALMAMSLFTSMSVKASDEKTMAIAISPLQAIFLSADMLYQYKVTDFLAITAPVKFSYSWLRKVMIENFLEVKSNSMPIAFELGVGAKFFMGSSKQTCLDDSFYLEPRLNFNYDQLDFASSTRKIKATTMGLNPMAMLGWDWVYDSGFFMNLEGGAGPNFLLKKDISIDLGDKDANYFVNSILAKEDDSWKMVYALDFKLGYAF
jgi:hypothetical protein